VTLVIIPSGARPGSYRHGGAPEQEWVLGQLDNPAFGAELAAAALNTNSAHNARSRGLRPRGWMKKLAGVVASLGINPRNLDFRLRKGFGRGEYLGYLRSVCGLVAHRPASDPGPDLRFDMVRRSCQVLIGADIEFRVDSGGARFLASGWSHPESSGVWSDGPMAELMFDFGCPLKDDVAFDFSFHTFHGTGQTTRRIEISAGGHASLALWEIAPGKSFQPRLVVPASAAIGSLLLIRFRFLNPASPKSLGLSGDPRELTIHLVKVRIEAAPGKVQ
jgi:hypothetical protein